MRHARASVSFMMKQISFVPFRKVPILHVALPIPIQIACSVTGAIHALPQQSDVFRHQFCPFLRLATSPEQIAAPLHESEHETRRCEKLRIRFCDLLGSTIRLSMPPSEESHKVSTGTTLIFKVLIAHQFFSYTPRC